MNDIDLNVLLKDAFKSMFQGLGTCISGSNSCFMVVFQYGSIVLFNVREPEVDDFLKIVRTHASGLLPEMRKDGEILLILIFQFLLYFI